MDEVQLFDAQFSQHILVHFPLLWLWDYMFSHGQKFPDKSHLETWSKGKERCKERVFLQAKPLHFGHQSLIPLNCPMNRPICILFQPGRTEIDHNRTFFVLCSLGTEVAKHWSSQLFTGQHGNINLRLSVKKTHRSWHGRTMTMTLRWVRGEGSRRWWHHAPCYWPFNNINVIQQYSFQSHAIYYQPNKIALVETRGYTSPFCIISQWCAMSLWYLVT